MLNKNKSLYIEDLERALAFGGVEALKGKKFLITGASGLIGMFLIDALMRYNSKADAGIEIYAVGRNKEKASARLGEYYDSGLFHFIEQDVCNPFPEGLKVDYILPLASNTHPLAYSQFPIETMLINIKGAEHALNLALECDATVLYPSSVEIYGNARGEDIFVEDYTGNLNLSSARSCYSESKRSSEALCLSYMAEKGAKVKIVRLSRIFGPSMLLTDTKASSQFILKSVAGEDVVLKSKGDQFFSYTYVADAVSAMLYVLLNGEQGVAYNVSNKACDVHLRDFASFCAKAAGKEVIFDLPSETERKGYSVATQAILDNSRLIELGWKPAYNMDEAVSKTISVLKN